ncbi:MAG: hypothetical protein ABEJ28_07185 [Salinigranum sp.]
MSLDELNVDVTSAYREMDDEISVDLDRETKNELATLTAVFESKEPDELVRRAIHLLFQNAVDRGTLDFHLRRGYDVTYDEYLSGMTYEEMTGDVGYPPRDDERRYQM